MRITNKRAAIIYALILAFVAGVVFFLVSLGVNGATWASNKANRHIYSGGRIVNAGTIYDINGKVLAKSEKNERVFAESAAVRKATLHVVGDTSGFIATGTHYLYRDILSGYSFVNGIYTLQSSGTGTDITLNIDSEANKIAYEALGSHNGAVAVYNYKTGQLLCSVSKPTYDIKNKPSDLMTNEKYDGVFLDKVVSGIYTPGSVMKIVTAACAIENIPDIYSRTFECDGKYETSDGTVICNGVHGTVDFQKAMNESCNCAFAEISLELGADKLLATAESMGFNSKLYAKEVRLTKSRFSPSKTSKAELGWAGIGQYTTEVTPYHMMLAANAIANGGRAVTPHIISFITDGNGIVSTPETSYLTLLDSSTAAVLDELMRNDVIVDYGDSNFPAGMEVCGKTGTAEVGDDKKDTAWFFGYCRNPDTPYAFAVVVEEGGYGRTAAMPIVISLLQQLA